MSKFNESQLEEAVEIALAYEDEEDYCQRYSRLRKSERRERDQVDRRKQKHRNFDDRY